jgi:fibronectin type 3 domain-containing protein
LPTNIPTGQDATSIINPNNLIATASNSQIVLNWDAVSNATGYNIKRATATGGPYEFVASNVSGTTYTDTSVTNGTTYYYVVTATSSEGESGNSNEASATPQQSLPNAPTNLSAAAGNAQVSLSWTAVTDAAGYNVKRATTAGGPYASIATDVSAAIYTDNTVTNGTTYHYVVTAVNAVGESSNSNEVSATPQELQPGSPTGLSATAGNAQVGLAWNTVTDATGYNVKRATTSGGPYETLASNIAGTTYTDTSVTNNTTYYYVVTAMTSEGESANSNEASATPQVDTPQGNSPGIDIDTASTTVQSDTQFVANVVINNASNLYAEDVRLGYDASLFEFVSAVPANTGLQIYHQETSAPGNARFIVASKGEQYGVNGSGQQILIITLKAKNIAGTGRLEVTSGLVADNYGTETVATVGGKDITVGAMDTDINSDGRYSLGDLAITSFNFSKNSAAWTNPKVDVDRNDSVDDTDLTLIVQKILTQP